MEGLAVSHYCILYIAEETAITRHYSHSHPHHLHAIIVYSLLSFLALLLIFIMFLPKHPITNIAEIFASKNLKSVTESKLAG